MKIKLSDLLWIINSLKLDLLFIKISRWNISTKLVFILNKYILIIKHIFIPFKLSESFIYVNKKKIFYDSRFGLADYQSMLTRHQFMAQIANIKNVNTIIDIGANVGFFTLLFNNLFPKANIYSFEPIKMTYKALQLNTNHLSHVKVHNLAISNKKQNLVFKFSENNSSASSISKFGDQVTKSITLDSFTNRQKLTHVDVLKIDVEGFEHLVLKGAKRTLANTKYLFIEITIKDNNNYSFSSLLSLMHSNEYDYQLVAFRNYSDVSFGEMSIMDALFVNLKQI